jgi:hypothetical protein
MSNSATLTRQDISPEVAELLRAGAADHLGFVCSPGQVQKNWAAIREAERAGYLRFLTMERPWITPAGRAVIGAPTEAQVDRAKLEAMCKRKPLKPTKKADPRTDFDYRSYRSMGYACTLVVKQVDRREDPPSVRVGRSLTSDPQFLGPNNSIVQPESEGRFVLAVMPDWLIRRAGLSTYPMPIDDDDPDFTDDERATWARLRLVCQSINSRIRTSGRRLTETFRYGENA